MRSAMPHSFHAPQTLTLFLSRSLRALFARRYYATPTLLIEFDDSRGNTDFTLMTDDKDLMSEPSNESIITKLAVLTMKFNKARYLWSRNPKETVEIFKAVKELDTSHVDPKTAVEFGGSDEIDKMLGIAGDDDGKGGTATTGSILVTQYGVGIAIGAGGFTVIGALLGIALVAMSKRGKKATLTPTKTPTADAAVEMQSI